MAQASYATSPEETETSPGMAAVYRKIGWRLLPFLCVCYMFSSLDRVNVSFAKLQMLEELQFSEAIYGLGAGIFFIGYILFEVPSNAILQRVGANLWIARIMVTWGIFSTLMMFVTTPTQFYILRFLLGAAEAGALPGILYFLTGFFPSARRGRVTAAVMLSVPIASIIGGPLSGWIMESFHKFHGLSGWQWMFLLEGLPPVLLGIATPFVLPRTPPHAKWLSDEEKALHAADMARDTIDGDAHSHRFMAGLTNPKVWVLGGIDFSILLATYAIMFWMPTFLRQAGATDLVEIGFLSAIPSIAGIAGLILISRSSDRMRERRWHIVVPFLITAAALVGATFFLGSVPMIVIFFSIAVCMINGTMAVFFTLPATFLKGPAAAAGFALACSLASTAGLISNTLIGFLVDLTGTAQGALWCFAASLIVSSGLVLSLSPKIVNR